MYKRITHTIVEEHFDDPMAGEIKAGLKFGQNKKVKLARRYYPDGEEISSNLPPSFCMAIDNRGCGNCLAFDPTTKMCSKFSATVRPEYVCAAWTAIPS